MKTYRALRVTAAIFCALGSTAALAAAASSVDSQYTQPSRFTDFNIYGRDAQWSASYFATQALYYEKRMLERWLRSVKTS